MRIDSVSFGSSLLRSHGKNGQPKKVVLSRQKVPQTHQGDWKEWKS